MRRERFLPDQIVERYIRGEGDRDSAPAGGRRRPGAGTAEDGVSRAALAEGGGEPGVTRRDFVRVSAIAGGGLLLAVGLPGCGPAGGSGEAGDGEEGVGGEGRSAGEDPDAFRPSAFVRIHPDNTATITVHKSEMGQGVRTALALLVAEELDLDWERVTVEQAPADEETYGRQGTGGSTSVRTSWTPLREAGAKARAVLVAAAAETWGVEASGLETRDSEVIDPSSDRRATYGELAEVAARQAVPEEVELKSPEEWRLLGRPHGDVDAEEIVTGRPLFASDIRTDGMVYAAVARTPVHGGSVRRYDPETVMAVPGVHGVVEVPAVSADVNVHAGLAVLAENSWAALRGRDALEVEWDPGPGAGDTSEQYSRAMREAVSRKGDVTVNRVGDPDRVIGEAGEGEVVAATFEVPFLSHATMEPMNCVAEVEGDRCRLRAPTQFPNWAKGATAEALGIPPENVEVEVLRLGGGYGRRINPDYAVEAALIAREATGPVKVVWSREDDMRHDFYRPPAVHRIEAVSGEDGYPVAWRQRFSTPAIDGTYAEEVDEEAFGVSESDGAGNMLYRVPNRSCEYTYLPSHITRGWWRAVHTTHGTFAVESFIDELAERAGIDPVEYRLALIDELQVDRPSPPEEFPFEPERLKGVLRLAADRAGWGDPLPEGRFRGVACGIDHLSYAAEVLELSMEGARPRIHRVVAAVDCGPVINPDIGRAQVEGGVVQGLSAALRERLTVQDGAIRQGNFDAYPLLRLREAPVEVEVHFAETDAHPTGLGEPGVPPAAPALANALYRATGRRHRTLPIEL